MDPLGNRPVHVCVKPALGALIVLLALAVFWCITGNGFIDYDDPVYIFENPYIKDGLTADAVRWSLTSLYASNWHPVTWWSHMLDVSLFGFVPSGHHAVSLLMHIVNSLLLFTLLDRMTGDTWKSSLVGILFAIHPAHVESVAWAAERKDLLCAFFGLLSLHCWNFYIESSKKRYFLLTAISFVFSLMSKAMLVTMPLLLLVLDFWPYRRISADSAWRRIAEKIPFVIIAAAAACITVIAQRSGSTIGDMLSRGYSLDLMNVPISYTRYVLCMVWPHKLSVIHPFDPAYITWEKSTGALLLLLLITVAALRMRERQPWLLAGWAWYLISLLPVIGIVPIGAHAMAERYTYLPFTGLFVSIVWCSEFSVRMSPALRKAAIAAVLVIIFLLVWVSRRQAGFWKDSFTVFSRAVEVTERNYIAHNNLAAELLKRGESDRAQHHVEAALAVWPEYPRALMNMGAILGQAGDGNRAFEYMSHAARNAPHDSLVLYNLAVAALQAGEMEKVEDTLSRLKNLDPEKWRRVNILKAGVPR